MRNTRLEFRSRAKLESGVSHLYAACLKNKKSSDKQKKAQM